MSDPTDARPFLHVQPADDRLAVDAAVRFARQVHALGDAVIKTWLATAGADDGVAYYLGVGDDAAPDALARLGRACRTAFPRGYEIARVDWTPAAVLGDDPDATAAIDLTARADRPRD